MKIVALLDSMWGWGGYNTPGAYSPRFFRINPNNHSGRRLYRLCGAADLLVTNSCKITQRSASHHGIPDSLWVKENLERAKEDKCDLFLICGAVAKKTYAATGLKFKNVLFIDHPAARRWSIKKINLVARKINALRQ